MRLAKFIRAEMESILQEWEDFANTILSAEEMDKEQLRDHAKDMLLAIADDLEINQSDSEQTEKSKGKKDNDGDESWAEIHGGDRQSSGFSVNETISEFRALRASVISLWTNAYPNLAGDLLEDLNRFNEAIDQAVAESMEEYTTVKERETRLFGAILLASPDPIYVLDPDGKFTYANKATADLFALEPKQILGKSLFDLGFPYASEFQRNLEKVLAEQSTYRGSVAHKFGSGKGEKFEYVLAPVLDEDKKTEAAVCISRDVTEQAIAQEKIWFNAHHDLLTGLPNRRLFLDRLEQELKHARRDSKPLYVLFMDLDGFKEVNDTLGHDAGDTLLTNVAVRLKDCVREEDTIARLGGDEFTLILTGATQQSDAEVVAQSIIDALAKPFSIINDTVSISVSVGISFYPQDATSPKALLQAADKSMYKAKQSGTNQICFYNK